LNKEVTLKEYLLKMYDEEKLQKDIKIIHGEYMIGSTIFTNGVNREFFEKMDDNKYMYAMKDCCVEDVIYEDDTITVVVSGEIDKSIIE